MKCLSVVFVAKFLRSDGLKHQLLMDTNRIHCHQASSGTHGRLLSTNTRSNRKFTIAVEGNIGSGKTTFLDYFKKYERVKVLQEPVKLWQSVRGHNLLDLLYSDPSRWSLTFQTYVQLTMVKAHADECNEPLKLMERSLYSAKYCFVENLHRSGKMPTAEYVVLSEWFDWLISNLQISVDLIVYLRTTPEVVHDRVLARKRSEEQSIPLQYLQTLHDLHEDWLFHKKSFPIPCPVLVLNGNLSKHELQMEYDKYKETILFASEIPNLSTFSA